MGAGKTAVCRELQALLPRNVFLDGDRCWSARLEGDVSAGIRRSEVIERSLSYLPLYGALDTVKINTDGKTPAQAAGEIAEMVSL